MRLALLCLLAACSASHEVRSPPPLGDTGPMVARTAALSLRRDDPDAGPPAFIALAKSYSGHLQTATTDSAVVRVPSDRLDKFLDEAALLGEVAERRVGAQEVGDAHRDLRVRIENLEKSRGRYLALLDKAVTVADAAAVERELERVTGELERLKSQLEQLDGRVELAVVSASFSRKVTPGPVGWVFYGLFRGVKWLLVWD